ncbi:MAG: GH3 auxin-responsive promoter family protein [Gemmatimonadetes bacterium]|nr:GH3 auxin-responsive promoter family protein [Gemmatimonadota bacterium]
MGKLVKAIIRIKGSGLARKLDRAAERPQDVQRDLLRRMVKANANTAFGKDHGFASIRTEGDYRCQVPIRDYEGLRPYVNRITAGEQAVLTSAAPRMLNMTSGTTGEPKYIPVTPESMKLASSFSLEWIYRALQDHPGFLDGAFVGIVSRAIEGYTPSGLPYGSASGMLYQRIPGPIRSTYAVPYAVSEIKDYDRRYFVAARLALARRVTYIGTPNPSTLIRLAETALKNAEAIVRAVHDGTPGIDLPDQPQLADQLSALIEPDSDRAGILESILERTGTLLPADCWPDLKLIGCWLGGSVGVQARKLPEYYGDVPMRDLGFLASEGHFTLPNRDNTASGILSLNGKYYEFIPETSLDDADPPVLSSHELESGVNYAVLLTTPGGLYRYDIHDIVQVTGFYRNAPLLAFIRKGRDMTSITGEKMHVNHLLLAFEEVRRRFDVSVVEQFRVVASVEARRYEIYAELKGEFSREFLLHEVIPHLDHALAGVNVEYAEKRGSRRLAPPCLHLMRPGWAEAEVLRAAGAGKRDIQYKWRILGDEPADEDADAILNTLETVEDG